MNKSRLNADLKAKSTRSRWEARWESACPFLSAQIQKSEGRREQRSRAVEEKKHDKGKRLDIQSKNQKNRKPDRGRLCRFGGIRYSLFSNQRLNRLEKQGMT